MLIRCAECEAEIAVDTDKCTACGTKKPFSGRLLSAAEAKVLSTKERYNFARKGGKIKSTKGQKVALGALGIFVVWGIAQLNKPLTPEEQAQEAAELENRNIRYACRQQIERNLLIPESVEYDRLKNRASIFSQGEGVWLTTIELKSKNAFNVMIPAIYQCKVRLVDGEYQAISLREIK